MRRGEGTFCASFAGCARVTAMILAVSLLPRAGEIASAAPIVPAYSSSPGTHTKIYLDFDGDVMEDFAGKTPGTTPAYSIDADTENFSPTELTNIQKVWQSVAEKYSPFNVNVTTVHPGNQNHYEVMRIVVGGDGAWLGQVAGGVAAAGSYM